MSLSVFQDEKNKHKAKFVLNQGTFLGLALVAIYLVVHLTSLKESFLITVLVWGVFIGFIYNAMWKYRQHFQEGILSYGQGVWVGVRMGMLAGIIKGAYLFLYFKVINPGALEEMVVNVQEAYLQMGMSADQVASMDEVIQLMSNPILMVFSGIIETGFAALIFSLIIAIFLHRKGDSFTDAMKKI